MASGPSRMSLRAFSRLSATGRLLQWRSMSTVLGASGCTIVMCIGALRPITTMYGVFVEDHRMIESLASLTKDDLHHFWLVRGRFGVSGVSYV
jgi:tRNA isopentenyl-2-thiomethyl-A-37 hydroxylase MiaE